MKNEEEIKGRSKRIDATLRIPIISDEQLKHLQKARSQLTKAGITFDSGYDLRKRIFEWKLDWSLKGAELVILGGDINDKV